MIAILLALAGIFAELSVLASGGGNTILPEMQRQVVDVHHWLTPPQFAAMYALAQAAPGPNMMVVPLIGWHVAGLAGVVVSSVAKFGPSSVITGIALHLWERSRERPWRRVVQAGLLPVTAGLVAASAAIITASVVHGAVLAAIVAAVAVTAATTRVHPLLLLGVAAVVGLTGVGQI